MSKTLPQKDPNKSNKEQGLYEKYTVIRNDGKEGGPYFVLDTVYDPHARVALQAYADSVEPDYPYLAADMRVEYNL